MSPASPIVTKPGVLPRAARGDPSTLPSAIWGEVLPTINVTVQLAEEVAHAGHLSVYDLEEESPCP